MGRKKEKKKKKKLRAVARQENNAPTSPTSPSPTATISLLIHFSSSSRRRPAALQQLVALLSIMPGEGNRIYYRYSRLIEKKSFFRVIGPSFSGPAASCSSGPQYIPLTICICLCRAWLVLYNSIDSSTQRGILF